MADTPTLTVWELPEDFPMSWRMWLTSNGGREIVLRRPDWYGDRPGGDTTEPLSVWVEVSDVS